MKPQPARTIGQLHFEDLEPHRFEDLVRQLAYGFKDWIVIEALGRSGADDGVDIRGVERAPTTIDSADVPEESGEAEERTWFIQCKREKVFGPAKAQAVAKAAVKAGAEAPFGFVLAAPCDLSKKTRETLSSHLRTAGVRQIHAWGRGELEDMLFLPENDHLLFAYFGISPTVQIAVMVSRLAGSPSQILSRATRAIRGRVSGRRNR